MTNFDATHSFDAGYYAAVCGESRREPKGCWMMKFLKDYWEGYNLACSSGHWNSLKR